VDAATALIGNTRDLLLNAWTFGMRACMPRSICADSGLLLRSQLPAQQPAEPPSQLDSVLQEYWDGVESYVREIRNPPDSTEIAAFRDSVTKDRILDLHRWGWHEAKRKVPLLAENRDVCNHFIQFWTDFCQTQSAEELQLAFKGVVFTVEHEGGPIRVDVKFIGQLGQLESVPGWQS